MYRLSERCFPLAALVITVLLSPAHAAVPEGPPPAASAVERGNAIYAQSCAVCHGGTGRGGNGTTVDLTASAIAMANDGGRQLASLLETGRPDRGMPPRPVTESEAADLSAKLRSFAFPGDAIATGAGVPVPPQRVLVGDAQAGKAYFNGPIGRCYSCHAVTAGQSSPATNLAGIGTTYPDAKTLQNNMILKGRRYYWSPANSKDVTATVTYRDGRVVTGYLSSVSDFKVIVRDESGKETIMDRRRGEPRVVLTDRMQHHLDLLPRYLDSDIHDLTAYLATLK
jgi:cytochrome c oxidase cbb3-type subunit 3